MQAAGQHAWGSLLSAYLGQKSVTFGTIMSGRTSEDSDDIAFPCITTVPTVVDTGIDEVACLNSLMQFNADMHHHQFVPLKQIQRWAGHGDESLFDTLFTLQRRVDDDGANAVMKYVGNELIIDVSLPSPPLRAQANRSSIPCLLNSSLRAMVSLWSRSIIATTTCQMSKESC